MDSFIRTYIGDVASTSRGKRDWHVATAKSRVWFLIQPRKSLEDFHDVLCAPDFIVVDASRALEQIQALSFEYVVRVLVFMQLPQQAPSSANTSFFDELQQWHTDASYERHILKTKTGRFWSLDPSFGFRHGGAGIDSEILYVQRFTCPPDSCAIFS